VSPAADGDRTFLVLLRGINVGGNNVIRMADLRAEFERLGLRRVRTYIQSGNVLVDAPATTSEAELTALIEPALGEAFGYTARVATLTDARWREVIDDAPQGFADAPDRYRLDVFVTLDGTTPADLLAASTLHPEVDEAWAGRHAVYFRRLTERASSSRLSKLIGTAPYRSTTARNWNTTVKLLAMLEE
jgi:uncharacterized protein (DUF1697 family)